jgi:hypothetical protein
LKYDDIDSLAQPDKVEEKEPAIGFDLDVEDEEEDD